jgi:hypothetical protein
VPGGHLASRGIAKNFLTWSMVAWGVISIATAYTTNETQLIALRFVLGRGLFLFEGFASFFLIIPWALTVEEDPQKAKWISRTERDYILGNLRAEQEQIATTPAIKNTSFLKVMGDSAMWKLIVINFFYQTAIYAFVIWLPTVIKNLTQTNIACAQKRNLVVVLLPGPCGCFPAGRSPRVLDNPAAALHRLGGRRCSWRDQRTGQLGRLPRSVSDRLA